MAGVRVGVGVGPGGPEGTLDAMAGVVAGVLRRFGSSDADVADLVAGLSFDSTGTAVDVMAEAMARFATTAPGSPPSPLEWQLDSTNLSVLGASPTGATAGADANGGATDADASSTAAGAGAIDGFFGIDEDAGAAVELTRKQKRKTRRAKRGGKPQNVRQKEKKDRSRSQKNEEGALV